MYNESAGAGLSSGQAVTRGSRRVVAVFAGNSKASLRAIRHVRGGTGGAPVWLYTTVTPSRDVADLCEHVVIRKSPVRLLLTAQRQLWPLRAALSVGVWTGDRGHWLLKLCPFLVPPFRTLFLNDSGDFLPGTPGRVAAHGRRRLSETAHRVAVRGGEIAHDVWQILRFHLWRSGPVNRAKDWVGAASLFLLATLLRLCAYPHRRWFARVHGDKTLHIGQIDSHDDEGIVWFEQHDPHWSGAALAKLVHGNMARWLVWHGTGTAEISEVEISDLLPLFDRSDTFAVSRQASYRAWKPLLIPTAPFRALQPGEWTCVLAPLGDVIVADIRKLAALGIPDASHPITAWMLLFWKAAAAGWRCYSAGQTAPLRPQPDFPTDETAFFLRVALDPACRMLGPRQPLLGRGNIAFSAGHRPLGRSDGARLKVLVVSPFLPYPLSHGGAVRIYNLCRALHDRVEFSLIAIRESQEAVDYPKLHEVFREVHIVDIDQTAGLPDSVPEQARIHECPSLRALIADVCLTLQPDVVQFEYTHTAGLKSSAGNIPAILVEHDITFSLYRQLAQAAPGRKSRREYQRWLEFESRSLAEFEAVWTVSESDRAVAIEAGRRSPERTFSVPNGVDLARFVPTEAPTAQPEILYVGSFRHLPNIIAFEKLRTGIMPLVWARFPDAVLRVVAGPRHQYFWDKFGRRKEQPSDPRIHIHHFVEDLRPLYAKATVVVAPLEVSAGTNIKIMEAMAAGRPIVSTPPGCAGLDLADGRDLLIRTGPADFADAVCRLLEDTALRDDIGRHARHTVEERFSWSAIAGEAYRSYELLVNPCASVSIRGQNPAPSS